MSFILLKVKFHYEHIKPTFAENETKTFHGDTDSVIYHIKTKSFYKDISEDVKEWLGSS